MKWDSFYQASLSVRLPTPLYKALLKACDKDANPYAPTKSQIIVRGLELALEEFAKKGSMR